MINTPTHTLDIPVPHIPRHWRSLLGTVAALVAGLAPTVGLQIKPEVQAVTIAAGALVVAVERLAAALTKS